MSVSSDSPLPTPPDADGLAALPDTVARRSGRADRSPAERSSVDGVPRVAATDGELLGLFTRNGDGEALDRLIDRHAAMVWQVCRQTVRRREDAEDAFQATFLQLTKSARAIRSSDSAAGWLYRVAHRTALRARKRQAARREESLALDPTAPTETAFPDLAKKQTAGVLLEELRGLPTQYQTPLVLRYLEGQSRRAIADQTDTTVAAVQGRLARGKRLLRRRLLRRGVSLSASIGAVAVAGRRADAASAGPPGPLVAQAAANSTALATGGSVAASVAAMTLYREGVRAMLLASIGKQAGVFAGATLAMLLSIGVAGEGAVGVPAAETPQPPAAAGGSSGDAVTLDASVADAGEGPVAAAVELDSGEIETDSAAPAAKPTTAAV
ncbi:MAG: sigma-70 family RNA polymerase sigma factor, partial [Planctomycetota bacterium]